MKRQERCKAALVPDIQARSGLSLTTVPLWGTAREPGVEQRAEVREVVGAAVRVTRAPPSGEGERAGSQPSPRP